MDLNFFQARTKFHHRKFFSIGLENVTVCPAPRADTTQFPILNAKRFFLTEDQIIQGNGAYTHQDRIWYVWRAETDLVDPDAFPSAVDFRFKPGDALLDSDNTLWTVLTDEWDRLNLSWHLTCRNIVLHEGLRDSITIIRGKQVRDKANAISYDFKNGLAIVTNIPARVQPQTKSVDPRMDVVNSNDRYTVVVSQDVRVVLAQDRIRATLRTGEVIDMMWTAYRNAERIDELPILECQRI